MISVFNTIMLLGVLAFQVYLLIRLRRNRRDWEKLHADYLALLKYSDALESLPWQEPREPERTTLH